MFRFEGNECQQGKPEAPLVSQALIKSNVKCLLHRLNVRRYYCIIPSSRQCYNHMGMLGATNQGFLYRRAAIKFWTICKVIIGRNPIEASANTGEIQLLRNPVAYIRNCFTLYQEFNQPLLVNYNLMVNYPQRLKQFLIQNKGFADSW